LFAVKGQFSIIKDVYGTGGIPISFLRGSNIARKDWEMLCGTKKNSIFFTDLQTSIPYLILNCDILMAKAYA